MVDKKKKKEMMQFRATLLLKTKALENKELVPIIIIKKNYTAFNYFLIDCIGAIKLHAISFFFFWLRERFIS